MAKKILIGIQARSTSQRFPNKGMADLCGKPVLEHVVSTCLSVRDYLSKGKIDELDVHVALLVPYGDHLKDYFDKLVRVVEGDENDVLSRYWKASNDAQYDYIVRITGDCPMIPSFVIVKHIKCAASFEADYVSNVDERLRTEIDGWDCEVVSKRALDWLNANAKTEADREHVTTLVRSAPPDWAKVGHIIGFVDRSHIKLSVDTQADLDAVSSQMMALKGKLSAAYGSRKRLVWRL